MSATLGQDGEGQTGPIGLVRGQSDGHLQPLLLRRPIRIRLGPRPMSSQQVDDFTQPDQGRVEHRQNWGERAGLLCHPRCCV